MMKKKLNSTSSKGYNLDELRYQIVYKSLQKEFCKDKIAVACGRAKRNMPFFGSSSAKGNAAISGLLKGLSYADYAVMAFSALKTIKNITSFFRKKKRK